MEMDPPVRKPLIFDGMALPPFLPLRENAEKRFMEIRNLECRKDDIILATYPKSGDFLYRRGLHYDTDMTEALTLSRHNMN